MIQGWKDKEAEAVFNGRAPKGFPSDLVTRARRVFARMDLATDVEDLRTPPGHRLHKLEGARAGQWSISVNDQYRVCFIWTDQGPDEVEFVDYH